MNADNLPPVPEPIDLLPPISAEEAREIIRKARRKCAMELLAVNFQASNGLIPPSELPLDVKIEGTQLCAPNVSCVSELDWVRLTFEQRGQRDKFLSVTLTTDTLCELLARAAVLHPWAAQQILAMVQTVRDSFKDK